MAKGLMTNERFCKAVARSAENPAAGAQVMCGLAPGSEAVKGS